LERLIDEALQRKQLMIALSKKSNIKCLSLFYLLTGSVRVQVDAIATRRMIGRCSSCRNLSSR
jgi:hypothetical protein